MNYQIREFNLPALEGLSTKQIEVHLGLYAGYVANTNKLSEQITELKEQENDFSYAITETRRRLGFEFNGMRMHEYYFEQLEDGATEEPKESKLAKALSEKYDSWDEFISEFKETAMSRGIGWTVLYWDKNAEIPHIAWVADHELGTLAGLDILLAIDMWEHAFMVDYTPAEKALYIDAFLANLNWNVVSERFEAVS